MVRPDSLADAHVAKQEFLGHEKVIERPAKPGVIGREGSISASANTRIEEAANLLEQTGRVRPCHIVEVADGKHGHRQCSGLLCSHDDFRVTFLCVLVHGWRARVEPNHAKRALAGPECRDDRRCVCLREVLDGRIAHRQAGGEHDAIGVVQRTVDLARIGLHDRCHGIGPRLVGFHQEEHVRIDAADQVGSALVFPIGLKHVEREEREASVAVIFLRQGARDFVSCERRIGINAVYLPDAQACQDERYPWPPSAIKKPQCSTQYDHRNQDLDPREIPDPDPPLIEIGRAEQRPGNQKYRKHAQEPEPSRLPLAGLAGAHAVFLIRPALAGSPLQRQPGGGVIELKVFTCEGHQTDCGG